MRSALAVHLFGCLGTPHSKLHSTHEFVTNNMHPEPKIMVPFVYSENSMMPNGVMQGSQ